MAGLLPDKPQLYNSQYRNIVTYVPITYVNIAHRWHLASFQREEVWRREEVWKRAKDY